MKSHSIRKIQIVKNLEDLDKVFNKMDDIEACVSKMTVNFIAFFSKITDEKKIDPKNAFDFLAFSLSSLISNILFNSSCATNPIEALQDLLLLIGEKSFLMLQHADNLPVEEIH